MDHRSRLLQTADVLGYRAAETADDAVVLHGQKNAVSGGEFVQQSRIEGFDETHV